MKDHDAVRERFAAAGQAQVFRFWDQLNDAQRASLIEQAREIDLAEIARLNATLVLGKSAGHVDLTGLEPAPCIALPDTGGDRTSWTEAKLAGEAGRRPLSGWWPEAIVTYALCGAAAGLVSAVVWFRFRDRRDPSADPSA